LIAGSLTGRLTAYDATSYKELWRYDPPFEGGMGGGIAADETDVYVPYFSGRLIALSSTTGKERWRYGDAESGLSWPPVITQDAVYAASSKGLIALPR
jgi:outer membrane protein assembly factor BamB